MKTMVTRTSFCDYCQKERRPQNGSIFATIGETGWHVHRAYILRGKDYVPNGFTPHLFQNDKVIDGMIYFTTVCLMHGCGITISQTDDETMNIHIEKTKSAFMSIGSWNALILSGKDLGYRI